jgi:muconolactone delta-isomerase
MKFLVIRKPRIGGALVASSKTIRENKERALGLVKQGRLDCVYGIAGGGGSVSIPDADSLEQLHENIVGSPLFLSSEWDIRPLTDYSKYMDSVAAALEKQGR